MKCFNWSIYSCNEYTLKLTCSNNYTCAYQQVTHPWRVSFNAYIRGWYYNYSSNFLRNTLNKIYMAVFEKKYGSVQERKEIVIESETIKSMCNTFCVAVLVAGMKVMIVSGVD